MLWNEFKSKKHKNGSGDFHKAFPGMRDEGTMFGSMDKMLKRKDKTTKYYGF